MSETTHHGDWSQVYTGLEWVARWMGDHGYTDADIDYVVGRPAVPDVAEEPAPVPVVAEEPAPEPDVAEEPAPEPDVA